jgi:4-hydroxy-2-oxoheptanedioate aldolase
MRSNKAKDKIRAGFPVYGSLSPTTDPILCEYIGLAGFDFYMIDAEHGAITMTEVSNLVRGCECVDLPVWARIRSIDEKLILQYLDAGVVGVMMPGIKTAEDVQRLVAAVKYPPLGRRGLGPVRAASYLMGRFSQAEYVEWANQQTMVLPQIEDMECVKNLESILAVEGVDGFVIGPRDLAMSMGFYDGPAHDAVKTQIDDIIRRVNAAGKWVGTVAATAEQANTLTDKGVDIIINSVQGLLQQAAKGFLSGIRRGGG